MGLRCQRVQQVCALLPCFSPTGLRSMAGEALNRRNIWEPSVYFALGNESFHFAGQDISIHESMDAYGALIWPGVQHQPLAASVHTLLRFANLLIGNLCCRQ